MDNEQLSNRFQGMGTAQIADACLRENIPLRIAPPRIRPLISRQKVAGQVLPVQHFGSIDIFLEAALHSQAGEVMVIDNGGREDEACIGDLTVIEMRLAGLAGMIVWGRHRDTDDLLAIELPVFSIGSFPAGPRRLDPRTPDAFDRARIGDLEITRQDAVFADDDGIIFVPLAAVEGVMGAAEKIQHTETRQAERVRQGASLRGQFRFEEYLRQRAADPAYTLREHLLKVGGEIEV